MAGLAQLCGGFQGATQRGPCSGSPPGAPDAAICGRSWSACAACSFAGGCMLRRLLGASSAAPDAQPKGRAVPLRRCAYVLAATAMLALSAASPAAGQIVSAFADSF